MIDSTASVPRREPLGLDIYRGLGAYPLWAMLGWSDIRLRYRRSVLGPFWITLSMSIFIAVLGVIYSRIFNMDVKTYLPFLAVGFIVWGFISSTINESGAAYQDSEGVIKQIKVPFSVFVHRVLWRNFIVFLHTIILFVPIAIIFAVPPRAINLLALLGFALVYINQFWMCVVLSVLGTRFRDIPPIVATITQVTIFATPIMWPVSALGEHTIIAEINPFHHMIDIVRAPLLGAAPDAMSWVVCLSMAIIGMALAMYVLRRASRLIVYWL
ncbi:MAG TPA: ABC transporter permease [Gammaproteobacteria bacterium]|nr:ABC transporter permease [Gammaproteobacteria bacterium]